MCVAGLGRREVGVKSAWSRLVVGLSQLKSAWESAWVALKSPWIQLEVGLKLAWSRLTVVWPKFKNSNLKKSDRWSRMWVVWAFFSQSPTSLGGFLYVWQGLYSWNRIRCHNNQCVGKTSYSRNSKFACQPILSFKKILSLNQTEVPSLKQMWRQRGYTTDLPGKWKSEPFFWPPLPGEETLSKPQFNSQQRQVTWEYYTPWKDSTIALESHILPGLRVCVIL